MTFSICSKQTNGIRCKSSFFAIYSGLELSGQLFLCVRSYNFWFKAALINLFCIQEYERNDDSSFLLHSLVQYRNLYEKVSRSFHARAQHGNQQHFSTYQVSINIRVIRISQFRALLQYCRCRKTRYFFIVASLNIITNITHRQFVGKKMIVVCYQEEAQ